MKILKFNLPKKLKSNAEMIPKGEMFDHMNDVQLLVAIFLPQCSENFYFNHSLLVKSRLMVISAHE